MSDGTTIVRRNDVRARLESDDFKLAVARVLPKHLTADRFVRLAILATTRTPKLLQCDQSSLFNCLMQLSQCGLEPDGRRAHLVPYGTTCTLIIDYKGLAELAYRSGQISTLHADVVCENDEFEYDRGEIKRHKINFRQPRGDMYAAYAYAKMKDGSEKCEVMSKDEIDAIRKRSRAGQSGPWVTDYGEMAKKTVFRRLAKWIPQSSELSAALDAEDEYQPTQIQVTQTAAAMRPLADALDEPHDGNGKHLPDPVEQAKADVANFRREKVAQQHNPTPPAADDLSADAAMPPVENEPAAAGEDSQVVEAVETESAVDLERGSASWVNFAAASWDLAEKQGANPDAVTEALKRLKLTDCASAKRSANTIRRAMLEAAIMGGKQAWATLGTKQQPATAGV